MSFIPQLQQKKKGIAEGRGDERGAEKRRRTKRRRRRNRGAKLLVY